MMEMTMRMMTVSEMETVIRKMMSVEMSPNTMMLGLQAVHKVQLVAWVWHVLQQELPRHPKSIHLEVPCHHLNLHVEVPHHLINLHVEVHCYHINFRLEVDILPSKLFQRHHLREPLHQGEEHIPLKLVPISLPLQAELLCLHVHSQLHTSPHFPIGIHRQLESPQSEGPHPEPFHTKGV